MKRIFGIASVSVLLMTASLARAGGIGGGIGVFYDPISRTLILECLEDHVDISGRAYDVSSDYYLNPSDFAKLQSLADSRQPITALKKASTADKTDKTADKKAAVRTYYVVSGDEPYQIRLIDSRKWIRDGETGAE